MPDPPDSLSLPARVAAFLATLAAIAGIGWLDDLTGASFSLALLYLLPVVAAGWWLGEVPGTLAAFAAGGAWLADELSHRSLPPLAHAWNGSSRLLILLGGAVVAARLRREIETQSELSARLRERAAGEARLARTDPLSGLRNRRAIEELLDAEIARCERSGNPLCVAFVDVDNFKRLNDTRGHAQGDAFIVQVAEVLRRSARAGDIPARFAGDEFAVLLWAVSPEVALQTAERLRARFDEIMSEYRSLELGVSIGVAHFSRPPGSAAEALRRADEAMYSAKRAGKGRVAVWQDGDPVSEAGAAP
jgi:diguanylate cyclase (GGDEF)-like protein